MRAVRGVAQHYAWGDTDAIPRLLGMTPDGRPWAEMWFGTHPGGASVLDDGTPLTDLVGALPFMVKLLAAAAPLSLQTHPDGPTAAAGFADEQARGVPLDDPLRTFRDPHAKPELICALTPFTALCGFRPVDETLRLLDSIGALDIAGELRAHGLTAVLEAVYRRRLPTAATVEACRLHDSDEARLVVDLDHRYPGDPSAVVALLLHLVHLEPGEALYLGPGNLHAYVHGVGVEVMGSSDNVVRGGLTVKHVDPDALLSIVRPEPTGQPVLSPVAEAPGVWHYPTPGAPFSVQRYDVDPSAELLATGNELVLCTSGDVGALGCGSAALLAPGDSVLLTGRGTVFRVSPA
ncbi:MAG: mannose-6-phosphate isomerase, class I [Ilumatobacteraceae bacterium]